MPGVGVLYFRFFRNKNAVPQVAWCGKDVERRAYASIKSQLAPDLRTSKLHTHDYGVDFTVTSAATGARLRVQLKSSEAPDRVGFRATRKFWDYRDLGADVLLFALFDPRPGHDVYIFHLFDLRKKVAPSCLKGRSSVRNKRQVFLSEFHHYRLRRGLGPALLSLM